MNNNIYTKNGYTDRDEYLKTLAEEFGVGLDIVYGLANVLGPNEDFDGLVTELEDYSDFEDVMWEDECE